MQFSTVIGQFAYCLRLTALHFWLKPMKPSALPMKFLLLSASVDSKHFPRSGNLSLEIGKSHRQLSLANTVLEE